MCKSRSRGEKRERRDGDRCCVPACLTDCVCARDDEKAKAKAGKRLLAKRSSIFQSFSPSHRLAFLFILRFIMRFDSIPISLHVNSIHSILSAFFPATAPLLTSACHALALSAPRPSSSPFVEGATDCLTSAAPSCHSCCCPRHQNHHHQRCHCCYHRRRRQLHVLDVHRSRSVHQSRQSEAEAEANVDVVVVARCLSLGLLYSSSTKRAAEDAAKTGE